MGRSRFASAAEQRKWNEHVHAINAKEGERVADERRRLAAKIVMAVIDKIVAEIVRPGPVPEERECYEMAGELRALVPDLEVLAKAIIDVNDGVE